jgi:HlyD family secretion protein
VNTENPDKVLLPYLTANVHFVTRKESGVLVVPNAALRWTPSTLARISPDARSNPVDPPGDIPVNSATSKQNQEPKERQGVIWLREGDFARPIEVRVGISDGASTAVAADTLREGQEVIVGEDAQSATGGTQNPFLPQMRKR